MRLPDDAREAMREALILRIGDREADESREERDARTAPAEAALAWLDAPGIKLSLTAEDHADVLEALQYAADDYAYRAEFEEKHQAEAPEPEELEELAEYEKQQERYNEIAERLAGEPKVRNLDLTERDQADEVIGR